MIQKIELKVGLFLVISTMIIAAAIGYVAYKKGFFAKVYTFTLSSKSGEDLTEGMPVVFSGFKIGVVHALELTNDGSVLIKIKIPEGHVKWIRTDSTFILNKPLIGSARLVVVTDNLHSSVLTHEQVPEVVNVSDINETIKKVQPLLDKVNKIAANIEKLTANIADPKGDVRKILANAEKLTGTLSDPKGDVHKILANAEKVSADLAQKKSLLEMAISDRESIDSIHTALKQAQDITAQVDAILKKVDKMAGKTDDMLYGEDGMLVTVSKALKDVLAKLEKLNPAVDNINKISGEAADSATDLKLLREQIAAAVTSLSDLAREVEKKIPFKTAPEIKLP